MNPEKLKKLQAQAAEIRIGGKGELFALNFSFFCFRRKFLERLMTHDILGMPRRKKKVVHTNAATDDKKLQSTLKKLAVTNIPGIEEVNLIKNDGTVLHFNNPRTQASLQSNVFAITGHAEQKNVSGKSIFVEYFSRLCAGCFFLFFARENLKNSFSDRGNVAGHPQSSRTRWLDSVEATRNGSSVQQSIGYTRRRRRRHS